MVHDEVTCWVLHFEYSRIQFSNIFEFTNYELVCKLVDRKCVHIIVRLSYVIDFNSFNK